MPWSFSPTSLLARLPSLPSLPAVPLPGGLQQRLVAFLLRRALGAFVKPDCWDEADKVEADVRNGRVRIRDVEVDPAAINALLFSPSPSSASEDPALFSPVEFVSGRISSLLALVAFPSLTGGGADAKLDVEVEGVELVFRVRADEGQQPEELAGSSATAEGEGRARPSGRGRTVSELSSHSSASSTSSASTTSPSDHPHLAESTLSLAVAHDFISSSLSPTEDAELRDSLHLPATSSSVALPGAFGGVRRDDTDAAHQEEAVEDVEAGMLAGVVERILAKLGVRVKDVSVKLVWEVKGVEHNLDLRVAEVVHQGAVDGQQSAKSLSISPPHIYLTTPSSRPVPSSTLLNSSAPFSPSSALLRRPCSRSVSSNSSSSASDSDGEGDDFLAMSMGISDLRESTASLAQSARSGSQAASTMFRSARSFAPVEENEEDKQGGDDPFQNPEVSGADDDEPFATPQGSPAQGEKPPLPAVEGEKPDEAQLILSLGRDEPLVFLFAPRHEPVKASGRPEMVLSASLKEGWTLALEAKHLAVLVHLVGRLSPSSPAPPLPTPSPTAKPASSPRIDIRLPTFAALLAYPSALSRPFDSVFSPSAASAPLSMPHLRLALSALCLTSSASGFDFSIASLFASETSGAPSGTCRTLPLLVSDRALPSSISEDASVQAVDWVRLAAGEAVEGGEKWEKDGRFLGGKKRNAESALAVSSPSGSDGTQIQLAPLHVFADLALLERLAPLLEIVLPSSPPRPSPATQRPSSVPSSFNTPRPSSPHLLDDLSLPTPAPSGSVTIACPLLRLSVRCPAPGKHLNETGDDLALRSGRLLVDLAGLCARTTSNGVVTVETEELAVRFASRGSGTVKRLARLAPLAPLSQDPSAALPFLTFAPSPSANASATIAVSAPLVHLELDKPNFDGLQLFADDLGQFFASLSPTGTGASASGGTAHSGIGSEKPAAKQVRLGESAATLREASATGKRTMRFEVEVTDVIVDLHLDRLVLPTHDQGSTASRHLCATASDLSAEIELFQGGEDDLRVDLQLMDVAVEDASSSKTILARTLPRNLTSPTPPAPLVSLALASSANPDSGSKSSRFDVVLANLTVFVQPGEKGSELAWLSELAQFAKAPEGAFETAIPSELTSIDLHLSSLSLHAFAPTLPSQAVVSLSSADFSTDLHSKQPSTTVELSLAGLRGWAIDGEADLLDGEPGPVADEVVWWKRRGFVQLVELAEANVDVKVGNGSSLPELEVAVSDARLEAALCADTLSSVTRFAEDWASALTIKPEAPASPPPQSTTRRLPRQKRSSDLLASVDPDAFERAPALQDLPEILDDDVPTNLDYLSEALNQTSHSPTQHRRSSSLTDSTRSEGQGHIISDVEGETIRLLKPQGLNIIDDYLAQPRARKEDASTPTPKIRFSIANSSIAVHLHEGYDWYATRKALEEEAKAVRRRLEKIRQLLATGQKPDATAADKSTVLMFGSVQLGLAPGTTELPPQELLAALNEELDGGGSDAVSTSSWQTFPRGDHSVSSSSPSRPTPAVVGKARRKLTRSRAFAIKVNLRGLDASYELYPVSSAPSNLYSSMLLPTVRSQLASKLAARVDSFDIIDNIKTSTWRKFLTELRPSDGGVVRPTGAPMARVELTAVRPVGGVDNAREELLLKINISPLRLYIDQDALDFLKAFGAFELPAASPPSKPKAASPPSQEQFFQRVEVLPVKLKLDYKPKRVDYAALRGGKTAELMNFFHFDGSEMTLRHLIVTGISGSSTLSSLVQDIWTPDVKAHQLADVISGIAPVRSVVNVGSGVANLVLLPLKQYRKDGRVLRGLQKGAQAFAKQTTLEAINVGARLANGTQVILEQAEHVLGGNFDATVAAEAVPSSPDMLAGEDGPARSEEREARSRYAEQPKGLKQGVESAYKGFGENVKEAAQTILAVPLEVYERSGSEGPVRSVVRAVPIAVLKPMIGASGAFSKALLGLRNTLDPEAQRGEVEDKYKRRSGGGSG
ncbi:autophagy-related protein 2 [Rhodosporidiobolus nylandii]